MWETVKNASFFSKSIIADGRQTHLLDPVQRFYSVTCFGSFMQWICLFVTCKIHSTSIHQTSLAPVLCLFWQLLWGDWWVFLFAVTSWGQNREKASGVKEESGLPIPDEPRKRNTRGCSSSYQPFSFLLMAAQCGTEKEREREKEAIIQSFAFVAFASKFCPTEPCWPEGGGYPRNYDKRVRAQGWEKGQRHLAEKREKEERKQSKRARWETSRKLPTMPLPTPLSQWGH